MVERVACGYGDAVSRVSATVDVDAPPEKVWEVIADPRNMPAWDRRIVSVRDVPETDLHEGSEYTTELRYMGLSAAIRARVRTLRPAEYAEVELSGLPLRGTVRTTLTPIDDGSRTRLDQIVDYQLRGGPVGRILGRILKHLGAQALLRRGTEAQKRQVEGSAG